MKRDFRRANAAVTALGLGAMLGFGALAVDVAYVRVANAQLQAAIDAAALAAAGRLDGTDAGLANARLVAAELASRNPVIEGYTYDPEQLVFGSWSDDDGFVPTEVATDVNAVRIDAQHGGISAILAGAAFDRHTLATQASALAARPKGGPASNVDCWLPIALPYCEFADSAGTIPDPIYVKFGTDKVDNVGWAHPDGSNTDSLRDQLRGDCSSGVGVGDPMPVSNGENIAVVQEITKILNGQAEGNVSDWPLATFPDGPPDPRVEPYAFNQSDSTIKQGWGKVIAGPIALVDLDCDTPTFNGSPPPTIQGFTWGFIYDVQKDSAHNTGFMLQLDFANDYGLGTDDLAGADGNVILQFGPPVLVQ